MPYLSTLGQLPFTFRSIVRCPPNRTRIDSESEINRTIILGGGSKHLKWFDLDRSPAPPSRPRHNRACSVVDRIVAPLSRTEEAWFCCCGVMQKAKWTTTPKMPQPILLVCFTCYLILSIESTQLQATATETVFLTLETFLLTTIL